MSDPIWSQQPNESAKAFQAFVNYLDMGHHRSLEKLCERYRTASKEHPELPPTVRLQTLKNWSVRHAWQARIEAYGVHQSRIESEARLRQIQAQSEAKIQKVGELHESLGAQGLAISAAIKKKMTQFIASEKFVINDMADLQKCAYVLSVLELQSAEVFIKAIGVDELLEFVEQQKLDQQTA